MSDDKLLDREAEEQLAKVSMWDRPYVRAWLAPKLDRLARLEEFLAAHDAVEDGVADFTLHNDAVTRLERALAALR